MKLYENKREIELSGALIKIFTNNVPGHDLEFMISFDDVERLTCFGKTWTKKSPFNYGKLEPVLFIHREYCPTLAYNDKDIFLMILFEDDAMNRYFNKKKFHVWEEIK